MDPRNYGLNQAFLGCQGHGCSGCAACQGLPDQGVHGQGHFGQGQVGQGLMGQGCMDEGCQDKVAWELQVRMPKLAQVEVKNQVRGVHVMERHGCQVIAEVPQVKDRTGWKHVHGTRHWPSDTPESKVARCAEADGRFRTDAVVASQTGVR